MPVNPCRLLTAAQAKKIDSELRKKLGISTLVLMENAGGAVSSEALNMLGCPKRIAIFCGKGNNGGDGFVAVRHLLAKGAKPDVFLAGRYCELKNEAKINLDILLKLKQDVIEVNRENLGLLKRGIHKYHLIIDALLGVGLSGEVRGVYRDLIEAVNSAKAKVLSVDIPSGLDATTGEPLGSSVIADRTVTFIAKKRGMVFGSGPKYCGKVVVSDLGISACKII